MRIGSACLQITSLALFLLFLMQMEHSLRLTSWPPLALSTAQMWSGGVDSRNPMQLEKDNVTLNGHSMMVITVIQMMGRPCNIENAVHVHGIHAEEAACIVYATCKVASISLIAIKLPLLAVRVPLANTE